MAQTSDGYLWFGTFGGLARFDGVKLTSFDTGNTPQLPSDGIVNLHLDARGWLWISTYRGLVVRQDKQGRAFGTNDGWAGDYARTFAERTKHQRAELAHVARVSTMGELAASVAHELNQPLGAILSNAEAAEMFLNQDPPALQDVREILSDIRKDDERAGEVIRRMRSLLRKREMEMQTLDLNSV